MVEFLGTFTQEDAYCPKSVRWSRSGYVACDACLFPTKIVGIVETARQNYELCVLCYNAAERDLNAVLSHAERYDDEEVSDDDENEEE